MNQAGSGDGQKQENRAHGIRIASAFFSPAGGEPYSRPAAGLFRFAAIMAWREMRAGRRKFAAAVLCVAVAAAAVCGVRAVTLGLSRHLFDDARQWIAADVMALYYGRAPAPEQWEAVRSRPEVAAVTLVTEADASASSDQAPDPVTISLKAVDAAVYPFYGRLEVRSDRALAHLLDDRAAVVSSDVLRTLQVRVGGTLRIQGADFHIRDVIVSEPDEFAVPRAPIGRVIISQRGLERTGLLSLGGVAYYRLLVRTRPGIDRRALCGYLEQLLPDAKVFDYTSRMPQTTAALEWILPFLRIVTFLSIAVGAMAIAAAAYFHLLQREESVAILKALGATAIQIRGIFLLQALLLALAGFLVGAVCAPVGMRLLGLFAARYLNTQIDTALPAGVIVESAVLLLSAAAAAAWIPLARIENIRPWLLLRRDLGVKPKIASGSARHSVFRSLSSASAGAIVMLLLVHTLDSWRLAIYLLVAIGLAVVALYLVTNGTFTLLLRSARAGPLQTHWVLRQALANLHLYRRRSSAVVLVLASGVALSVVALLGESRLRTFVLDAIPLHAPNLLFIQVKDSELQALSQILASQSGAGEPEFVRSDWVTLLRGGNRTLSELRALRPQTWIQDTWSASCMDSKPPALRLLAGHWWSGSQKQSAVALDPELARLFGVRVGSSLDVLVGRRAIHAQVAAIAAIPPSERLWLHEMIFNCQALPGAVYSGGVEVAPPHLTELRETLRARFPDVTFLDIESLLQQSERIGREAARIVQLFAAVIIFAAAGLLLAVIYSLRNFRVYEIAVLRALGARRALLTLELLVEYAGLGALAGVAGAILGCTATSLALFQATGRLLWTFDGSVIVFAVVLAAVSAAAAGLFGSRRFFHPKPLTVLRQI